jgi:MFS family permease
MRQGLRAAWAQPSCRAATIAIGTVAFLAAPFIALVPAVALSLTHGGASSVAAATAALTTAQGAGAVVGALVLPALAVRIGRGPTLAWSLAVLPAALIGYGAAPSLWLAVAALFGVGLVYMGVLSGLQTTAQLHAPAAYRGRVLSFFLVALGVAYPIGALAQGPVADHIGVGWTTIAAALTLAGIYALVAWRSPGFVRAIVAPEADQQGPDTQGVETQGHEDPVVPAARTAEC